MILKGYLGLQADPVDEMTIFFNWLPVMNKSNSNLVAIYISAQECKKRALLVFGLLLVHPV